MRVRFAPPQRNEDGHFLATTALDQGYRCGERDKRYSRDPKDLLRGE
jgi:hypothetical protein